MSQSPRNSATGRSNGGVDGREPCQAVGIQRRGGGYERVAEHYQKPERCTDQSAGNETARVGRGRVGHAAHAGRLQREACKGLYRRRAAGSASEALCAEQYPREFCRPHRGVQGRSAGGIRHGCYRRVINIVTNKKRRRWFLDASYSYGSFNTHKSNVHFGQTFKNGFTYEINAFQNYSDNDYRIDSPVEDFETGRIDRDKKRARTAL